jgi:hypothetical protein
MAEPNLGSGEEADLSRYRQAADVAYQYAKQKLEKKTGSAPGKQQEPSFGNDNEKEEVK